MISDSLLFVACALFLAIWLAVVASISIAAFGPDLLPMKARSSAPDRPLLNSRHSHTT